MAAPGALGRGRFEDPFEDKDKELINNRQSGRRRGRGGNGQRPSTGNQGGRDSGNRIDSRARGNAAQLLEKYKNLARDAQMQGDRVNTEYYLQFADHYFRVLSDSRSRQEEQRQPYQRNDAFDDGDDFFGDEGEPIRGNEQPVGREDGNRSSRDSDRRDSDRRDGQRGEGQRSDGQRGEGQRRDQREPRVEEPMAEADAAEPREAAEAEPAPARSRSRGRSRRPVEPAADGAEAATAIEADRLPPAIAPTITVANDAGPADGPDGDAPVEKPKRRRSTRSAAAAVVAAD